MSTPGAGPLVISSRYYQVVGGATVAGFAITGIAAGFREVRGRRRRRVASGTLCYSTAVARWICETLGRHAAAHGVPSQLAPDDLRSRVF